MIKLLDDQKVDAEKMARGADLPNFSLPGTGKTYTALEAFRLSGLKRALVLAPKIAVGMWGEEAENFLGKSAQIIRSGSTPLRGDCITVTTYDIAKSKRAELYQHFRDGALILDESHYVRNKDAGRTKAVFGPVVDLRWGLAERFDQVWCLTGTPMVKYADDYYTQVAALHPDVFAQHGVRSYVDFERRFCFRKMKSFHPKMPPRMMIVGNTNELLLRKILYEEVKAIRRTEVKGLPALRHRHLTVKIKLDAALEKHVRNMSLDQIMARMNDPESTVSQLWRIVGAAKVHEVAPYVSELAKVAPVLVGIWHRDVSTAYKSVFAAEGFNVVEVNGSTPSRDLEQIRTDFNAGKIDILLGQMAAMGVSWNIQRACANVVIAEQHPTPSTIEQFYKRVYRFGQTEAVQLDDVISNSTLDEALYQVRMRKEKSEKRINKQSPDGGME